MSTVTKRGRARRRMASISGAAVWLGLSGWLASPSMGGNTQYLIIYARGTSSAAAALRNHRLTADENCYDRHPLVADTVGVQWIDCVLGNHDGTASTEELRDYILNRRASDPLECVVLIGSAIYNHAGYDDIPVPEASVDGVNIRSDALYVDGDYNGIEDLPIGRLPARNATEGIAIVGKIIDYDNTSWRPDDYGNDWRNGFLYSGYDLDVLHDGYLVRGSWVSGLGTFLTGEALSESQRLCGTASVVLRSESQDMAELTQSVISEVNDGVGIWFAYGTTSGEDALAGVLQCDGPYAYDIAEFTNNGEYPFLLGMSCDIGKRPTADECCVLRDLLCTAGRGVIGAIAPTEAVNQSSAMWMGLELMKRMESSPFCGEYSPVGRMLLDTKEAMLEVGVHDVRTILGMNLFGDPAMKIPVRGDLLSITSVDHDPAMPHAGQAVRISAVIDDPSNGEPPYPNMMHSYVWRTDTGEFIPDGGGFPQELVTYEPFVDWMCHGCPEAGTAHMSVSVEELQFPCNEDEVVFAMDWAPPAGGHDGCPIFERTENSQWRTLNSVMSQCAYDSVPGETDDYFQFPEAPSPSMSPLEFRIREGTSGEVSTVDFVELWRIDHSTGSEVLATDGGRVLRDATRIRLASARDKLGRSMLPWLRAEADSGSLAVDAGDTLMCVFPDSNAGPTVGRPIVRGRFKLQLGIAAPEHRGIALSIVGQTGEAKVYPRMEWSTVVADGLSLQRGDGIPDTMLAAIGELHEIDYIGLLLETGTAQKVVIPVSSAIHSAYGSVKPKVAAVDTLTTQMVAGQSVLLAFPRPLLQSGMTRDLVLHVRGRYELGGGAPRDAGLVRRWGIDRVWPNPTSGGATVLYVAAGGNPTRFKVFDVAGRLVRTIEYPAMAGGQHFAMWDGRDDRGRQIGSGVYFVQLEQARQRDRRKLIVLR